MLKKIFKLNSIEIKNLFDKKDTPLKAIRGVFFDIKAFYLKESINIDFKSAVILSSKNFKKAVIRNKIKRQVYSILETWQKENHNIKNTFFIIYPKKEIVNLSFLQLKKEVYNGLNNLKK